MADELRRFCSNCGALLQPDAKFCEECGTPALAAPAAEPAFAAAQTPPEAAAYNAAQPAFAAAQTPPEAAAYNAAQPAYTAAQPADETPQPAYEAPQQSYAAPQQGYYTTQQPSYGAQQPSYGAQQPGYGAQQPGYGAQQPGYGAQQAYTWGAGAPPQSEKKSKAWLIILLSVVAVLAIAAVVVFVIIKPFGNKQADPNAPAASNVQPSAAQDSQTPATEQPTQPPTTVPPATAQPTTEAPTTVPPTSTATDSYTAAAVGTWYSYQSYDVETEEFGDLEHSNLSVTLNADGTGTFTFDDGSTYDVTWEFDEVDEDGDYDYYYTVNGSSHVMYYMVEYQELWVDMEEVYVFFER